MARRVDTDCLRSGVARARRTVIDCLPISDFQLIVNIYAGRTKKGHALY